MPPCWFAGYMHGVSRGRQAFCLCLFCQPKLNNLLSSMAVQEDPLFNYNFEHG